MAFAPILASLAAINSSTSLIQGGISAVQSGISMIGQLFTKVFNKLGARQEEFKGISEFFLLLMSATLKLMPCIGDRQRMS